MNPMLFLYTMSVLALGQPVAVEAGPDREAVVAALKHNEGLVKTLQADYEYTMVPTTPEQAELIRRALGKKAEASLFTPEFAKHHTGSARFWRKGAKQRNESSCLDSSRNKRAFDGQIIRLVRHGADGRPVAVISSAETGDWYKMPREDPMAFLYLFYERPFSEVIASATTFSSAVVTRGKDRLYRVSVVIPPTKNVLDFLFDERFLQQERLLKVWTNPPKYDRLVNNHKLVFSNYRAYETPSGETIWFPDKIAYMGYSEEVSAPDGSQLESLWKEVHFSKVQFNIDMPDSLFELEIPKDARINDQLTGAGWLDAGKRPAALFPAEERARRLWVAAIVIAALVVVTAAVFYKRRRRRSAAVGG